MRDERRDEEMRGDEKCERYEEKCSEFE